MRRLFYLAASVLLFGSCEHKELCFLHPHTAQLQVEFDWSYAPDSEAHICVMPPRFSTWRIS